MELRQMCFLLTQNESVFSFFLLELIYILNSITCCYDDDDGKTRSNLDKRKNRFDMNKTEKKNSFCSHTNTRWIQILKLISNWIPFYFFLLLGGNCNFHIFTMMMVIIINIVHVCVCVL